MSSSTPGGTSWSAMRTRSVSTPLAAMIATELSISAWVLDGSAVVGFRVQLTNSALRAQRSGSDIGSRPFGGGRDACFQPVSLQAGRFPNEATGWSTQPKPRGDSDGERADDPFESS